MSSGVFWFLVGIGLYILRERWRLARARSRAQRRADSGVLGSRADDSSERGGVYRGSSEHEEG